jgi:NAD(P)-dependent dehydrogenase (short-subunit alcohol dehydrogenase family)
MTAGAAGGHLDGRVAVVTGAGRGIGRAVAHALAAEGAAVVVNDWGRDPEGRSADDHSVARAVVDEIRAAGGRALAAPGDVSSFDAAGRIVQQAMEGFSALDILVNVAGNVRDGSISTITPDDFWGLVNVHLGGTFNMCRHAFPIMRDAGRGRIVNTISSTFVGDVPAVAYLAAKGGIYSLTKGIALEGRSCGVTANMLAPGAATRLYERARPSFEAMHAAGLVDDETMAAFDATPSPDACGPVVVWLCSDAAASISGRIVTSVGGKVAAWRDPAEDRVLVREEGWTVDALIDAAPDLLG